jgi:hypothetical protein
METKSMAARHRRASARARNRIDKSHREEPTWKTCGDDQLLASTPKFWPHPESLNPNHQTMEAVAIHGSARARAITDSYSGLVIPITVVHS